MNKDKAPNSMHPFILEGQLNINEVRTDRIVKGPQRLIVRRFPKENTTILRSLAYEYHEIGFTQLGGSFRRRSRDEQIQFTRRCAALGLRVLPPLEEGKGYFDTLFLEKAEKMDEYLSHATSEQAARFTYDVYMDMYKAHNAGIIYGDRWADNILVAPNIGVVNIDFDIEISGPFAKEFEATQVACYILAEAKMEITPLLTKLLSAPHEGFHMKVVEKFLRGHALHFDGAKKYGSIENEMNALIGLLFKEYEVDKNKK